MVPPLDAITSSFALQNGQRLSNFSLVPSILSISPQTLIEPLSYTIDNLVPYDSKVYVFGSTFKNTLVAYTCLERGQ